MTSMFDLGVIFEQKNLVPGFKGITCECGQSGGMQWGVVRTIRWSTPTGLTSDDDDDDEGCF